MNKIDVGIALLRMSVGFSLAYHGLNKLKTIPATTSWFASIGMKWPRQQALLAMSTEIFAGLGLAFGILTPLCCIAVVGLMVTAIITVHARVGYFIFLPNGGWEYCASIVAVVTAISLTGPGSLSLDDVFSVNTSYGQWVLPVGLLMALCHVALSWRPPTSPNKP